MKNDTEIVRIDLTPNQKEQVRATIGKDAQAIELSVHELEERIAPITVGPGDAGKLIANHNETLLVDRAE